ncbi:hypothetical protein D3C76_1546870 [compost metagenome]
MHPGHEVGFAQPVLGQLGGRDAGDCASRGMRQDVVAGPAKEIDRLVDFIELEVSTQPRHLQRAVATGIDTRRFVVVPEDGGHGLFLN